MNMQDVAESAAREAMAECHAKVQETVRAAGYFNTPVQNLSNYTTSIFRDAVTRENGVRVNIHIHFTVHVGRVVLPKLSTARLMGDVDVTMSPSFETETLKARYVGTLNLSEKVREEDVLRNGEAAAMAIAGRNLFHIAKRDLLTTAPSISRTIIEQLKGEKTDARSHSPVAPPQPRAQSKPSEQSAYTQDEGFGAW